jgi:hypothetical protein
VPPLRAPRRLGWFSLLVIVAVVLFVVYAGLTPWALHIGGRSTPDEQWDGYGEVQASNGGRYVLFVHLQGGLLGGSGPSRRGGSGYTKSDNLHGTAELCTESGVTHTFNLTGVVDSWWATDNAPTTIDLTGGSPVKLQPDWVVALHGVWHGPALELTSPDNSFTKAFTPRGEIRRVTSTADAGTATVTLHYGSREEFFAACRALTHR